MRAHARWVIAVTLLMAVILSIVPLPGQATVLRPDWAALVLIYWCMALPHRVGVGIAWLFGLLQDVLRGALFGEYALGFALVAFIVAKLHRRLRLFPRWQQALSVMVLVSIVQLVVWWMEGIIGHERHGWLYWAPTLTSALLWSPVFLLLRWFRRRYRVN